jgi:lipopolysaccharide export system protein LptA
MRNSEARRYARWSAGVAILLAVVVAGEYLRGVWVARQAAKKAPPAVPAAVEQRSNEFSFSKVEGQRTIYTVRASHTTEFKEGSRNLLEDVSITVYGKKGERNDTLRTSACDFISSTGKIGCAGEVRIKLQAGGGAAASANAVQVVTSGVSFDRATGLARTDKQVMFRWPAGEGHAMGVQYDSNDGTLHLDHNVEMTLTISPPGHTPGRLHETPAPVSGGLQLEPVPALGAAEPQEKAVHLTGDSMLFRRGARTVQILGAVHALQTTHELTAESLLLELDESFHTRRLVASGHPQMRDSDVQGPLALDADEIAAALTPEGSVESIVANGDVHGSRNTSAGDDAIGAGRVQVELATGLNVPHLLTARGSVTLTSRSATPAGGTRSVESEGLEMHFSKRSLPGQTLLESVNTLAPARVEWQNVAAPNRLAANGKPVKQTLLMRGQQMNLQFDGQNQLQQLASSGGVEVTRKLGDGPEQSTASRELTAKFSSTGEWSTVDQTGDVRLHEGPRTGRGDRAHLDRDTNTATLSGSVILSDATMRTTAQSATFTQGSSELRADGNVLSTELRAGTGTITNLAQAPAHVSAAHLVADVPRGHAIYSGGSRLWQGDSVIEGDTVELDNASHILVARGHVRGVFPQAAWTPKGGPPPGRSAHTGTELWHVRGGLLTYWGSDSRARLEQAASAESAEGSIDANQIDLYFSTSGSASAAQQLSRAVATGDVSVRQEGRRGTSNRAEYAASEGKFVLSGGKPTVYDSTGDTTTGRQLTFFFADDRIVVDSEEGSRTLSLHRVEK